VSHLGYWTDGREADRNTATATATAMTGMIPLRETGNPEPGARITSCPGVLTAIIRQRRPAATPPTVVIVQLVGRARLRASAEVSESLRESSGVSGDLRGSRDLRASAHVRRTALVCHCPVGYFPRDLAISATRYTRHANERRPGTQ